MHIKSFAIVYPVGRETETSFPRTKIVPALPSSFHTICIDTIQCSILHVHAYCYRFHTQSSNGCCGRQCIPTEYCPLIEPQYPVRWDSSCIPDPPLPKQNWVGSQGYSRRKAFSALYVLKTKKAVWRGGKTWLALTTFSDHTTTVYIYYKYGSLTNF